MTPMVSATVDTAALRHNLQVVRRWAPKSRVMAVVKANAYGHGLVAVARALEAADALAVARVDEGLTLRAAGIDSPTVLLEGFFLIVTPDSVRQSNQIRLPFGDGKTSPVAVPDVARVIAVLLANTNNALALIATSVRKNAPPQRPASNEMIWLESTGSAAAFGSKSVESMVEEVIIPLLLLRLMNDLPRFVEML